MFYSLNLWDYETYALKKFNYSSTNICAFINFEFSWQN